MDALAYVSDSYIHCKQAKLSLDTHFTNAVEKNRPEKHNVNAAVI